MLVVPDSTYCNWVPIAIGTVHIDILIKLVTQEELGKLSHCWKRGGSTHQSCHVASAQLVSKKLLTAQINNDVKLTKM